jgi:hypothetical protein
VKLLSFDPSGNFLEGKGTTGYALFRNGHLDWFGDIKSTKYESKMKYWDAHIALIEKEYPDIVLIESYKLFEHKAKSQSWSELETPQMIGVMIYHCWRYGIPYVFQDPSQKQGVKDERLEKLGYLEKRNGNYYVEGQLTNLHMRDAIRHGIYYYRYGKGKHDLEEAATHNPKGL